MSQTDAEQIISEFKAAQGVYNTTRSAVFTLCNAERRQPTKAERAAIDTLQKVLYNLGSAYYQAQTALGITHPYNRKAA